jgi:hypothetical protein
MEFLPHQIKALDLARPILQAHGVVVLALECRLGKSFLALQLASEVANGGKLLFISKKAALGSIRNDAKELGVEIVATNYESLHKLEAGPWAVVILDECHRVSSYPKPCLAAKAIQKITGPAKCILLSATPAIESGAQWFHAFWATNRGPWAAYRSFYKWHKDFGIPASIFIAGGQEVKTYDEVRPEVLAHVLKYCVSMTQVEAGFVQQTQVVVHKIDNPAAVKFGAEIKENGIVRIGERVVLAENPAAILQKSAMACGGTLIDDKGEAFICDDPWASAKTDYIAKKLDRSKQYAIFTQFIAERDHIIAELMIKGFSVGDDMDAFKAGAFEIFVGSIKRFSEGVDLAWINGAMVLYSLTFSGSTYEQILNRMNKFDRAEPIKVHVLLVAGSIEEYVFKAVSEKKNFNTAFYKMAKNARV